MLQPGLELWLKKIGSQKCTVFFWEIFRKGVMSSSEDESLDFEKTIFSLFPAAAIQSLHLEQYRKVVLSQSILLGEGKHFDFFYVPIDTDILMISNYATGHAEQAGVTGPGRSVSLYSFIKSLPAPHSFIVKSDGEILAVPRTVMDNLWSRFPEVLVYLKKMVEDQNIQMIVKDMQTLGVNKAFIVTFVSNLEEKEIQPQQYLEQFNVRPRLVHFLVEGSFLTRTGNSASAWTLPLKSWVGWKEVIEGKSFSHSVLSLRKSKAFSLKVEIISQLRNGYPEDFKVVDKWIREGEFEAQEKDDDEAEVDNVRELFSEAIQETPWHLNYPFVMQNEGMDCGPACLSMISLFYKKDLSVQYWRSRLSTDQNGTTLFDLAKLVEKNGFISHCLEVKDLHEVDSFLFPFIALRQYHYCVVYKIEKDNVIIGDPAFGIRKIPLDKFYSGFEKVGLFMKPNGEFEKISASKSPWSHYIRLFSGLEKDFVFAFLCATLGVILSLGPPLISQLVLDDVLGQNNLDFLGVLLGAMVGISLIASFVSWAQKYYFIHIINKFNFRASSVFVQKMFSLPYQFFATRHVGDFTHRLNEMNHLQNFVTNTLIGVILNFLTLFLYGFSLFLINPKMAFFVVLAAPPMLILPALFSNYLSRLYGEVFSKAVDQVGLLNDFIKGVAVIKSFGAELSARLRFENKLIDLIRAKSDFALTALKIETFTTSYYQLANVGILFGCVYFSIKGEMTAGQVISFTLLASKFFVPILELTKHWDHFIETKSVIGRLNDIFLATSESSFRTLASGKAIKRNFIGEIEFKDVWFRYGGEATDWVLKGLNFKIEAGQKVAIVGPSGSGKSTIAHLLVRMYEPTRGQILIDGKDYRLYDIAWLRRQLGLLHQESHLYPGTIGENIAITSLNATEEQVYEAAERSASSEFIKNKPGGFEQYIPCGGFGLSGGEKQKIALARVFFQKPSVLILDEATSALDGISEEEILNRIKTEMPRQTVLSIAHRYTTVQRSDLALVILKGKFSGFGSLEFLKNNSLVFQKLFGFPQTHEQRNPQGEVA